MKLPMSDFSAGILSEKLAGRYDLPIYLKGATELTNWEIQKYGGVKNRSGAYFIDTTRNNAAARLFKFVVAYRKTFLVEVGCAIGANAAYIKVHNFAGADTEITSLVPAYTEAQLKELHVATNGKVLYFVHSSHAPMVLTWVSDTSFTYGAMTITGNDAIAWGALTAYAKDAAVKNSGKIYRCITAGTSAASGGPTTTSENITDGTVHWKYVGETAPFASSGNYPRAIGSIAGRLVFAGTDNEPQAIWACKPFTPGNFTYFETISFAYKQVKDRADWTDPFVAETEDASTVRDITTPANAFKIEINSEDNEKILSLVTMRDLLVCTTSGEWILPRTITATNPSAELQSRHGGYHLQPKTVDNYTYLATASNKLKACRYAYGSDSYEAADVTGTSGFLDPSTPTGAYRKIVDFDYAQRPNGELWVVDDSGNAWVMEVNEGAAMGPWWKYEAGGAGVIESIAIMPEYSSGDGVDYVFMIVKYGSIRHVVKFRAATYTYFDSQTSKTKSGSTITGLSNYEGLLVSFYDATETWTASLPTIYTATVASGSIAAPAGITNGHVVNIGLAFPSTLKTMRLPRINAAGEMEVAGPRRVARIAVVLWKTCDLQVGQRIDALSPAIVETTSLTVYVSKELMMEIRGEQAQDAWIYLYKTTPWPCMVLGIVPEVD